MDMTSQLRQVQSYWNEFVNDIEVAEAPTGSAEFFAELEAYRYSKIDYLKEYVGFEKYGGLRVLEVGCGAGIDLLQFARAGAHVTARDLTPNAVKLAIANLAREGYRGDVRLGNAESLDFPDESFDTVYSHGVLHHTVDTMKAVDEVFRVLRPGGEAIVMLYNRHSWFNLVALLSRTPIEHPEREAPIVRRYSVGECRRLFRKFQRVEIRVERFPKPTLKFDNLLAKLNNYVLVPLFRVVPYALKRPWGWHIMIRATK